jgi:hypothetical protein
LKLPITTVDADALAEVAGFDGTDVCVGLPEVCFAVMVAALLEVA